jgi:hypothetical protein
MLVHSLQRSWEMACWPSSMRRIAFAIMRPGLADAEQGFGATHGAYANGTWWDAAVKRLARRACPSIQDVTGPVSRCVPVRELFGNRPHVRFRAKTFRAEYKHPLGGICAGTLAWVYHGAGKNGGSPGSRPGSDPSWIAPVRGSAVQAYCRRPQAPWIRCRIHRAGQGDRRGGQSAGQAGSAAGG